MQKIVLRDVVLLAVAAALGWWVHGANTAVQAQHSNSSNILNFEFNGTGRDTTLSLYYPDTHMLYVYPTSIANSHINCAYKFRIDRPGGAIERSNCDIGSAF